MNTILNNKLLLLTALGTLMMNGCIAEENFQKNVSPKPTNMIKKSKTWKNIEKEKEDCPDCYASDFGDKKRVGLNLSKSKELTPNVEDVIETQNYGTYDYSVASTDTYLEPESIKVTPEPSYLNSSRDSFNTKLTSDTTIQVGAFRHYSGAKKIAKKYSLLSSEYSVKIETGIKEDAPIHRVHISGFNSKGQAKLFMQRYAINDGFFVRR